MVELEAKRRSLTGHTAALRVAVYDAASRLEVNPREILWFRGAEISRSVEQQLHPPSDPALIFPYANMVYGYGEGEDSNGIRRNYGDVLAKVKRLAPGGYQANHTDPVLPIEISYLTFNSRGIKVDTQTVTPSDKKLAMLEATEDAEGNMASTYREVYRFNPVNRKLDVLTGQQFTDPRGKKTTRTKWVDASELHEETLERVVDKIEGTANEVIRVFRGLYLQHPTLHIERRILI